MRFQSSCTELLSRSLACILLIIDILNSRPRTESFMIKQHLTFAVGLTQVVLLLSIAAYRKKVSTRKRITMCGGWGGGVGVRG